MNRSAKNIIYKPLPIVPWMGGKRRLAKYILPLFPEHTCYVELFAGGAALLFLRPKPAKCEVINDINGQLINLYRVVQHHFDEFVRQFDWALTSRESFARLQLMSPDLMTDIQRAARFYYLQHNAFGGKTTDQHFGTATTCRTWCANDIAERLQAARQRLNGVCIENEPWQRCFKRYDRPHSFMYCDPPYWQTADYGGDFEWSEYQDLAAKMASCQSKVMLSINDHPDIRELFKEFWCQRLELNYPVARNKTAGRKSGELVICNYSPN